MIILQFCGNFHFAVALQMQVVMAGTSREDFLAAAADDDGSQFVALVCKHVGI